MVQVDAAALRGKDPRGMSDLELLAIVGAERQGGVFAGELPLKYQVMREKALDSPAYLATEVLDPWYKEHFEPIHYRLMDEVLGPWLIGETVRIDGVNYDPLSYTGLGVLFSRSTIKSTILRMMVQWIGPYRKLREKIDARTMFCHQVIEKAIEHSMAIRSTAKAHLLWRAIFPEFAPPAEREWDTQKRWRWPCFTSYLATEWSFTAYGETSSKEGGHYTERLVDDWVTEDSVTTSTQLDQSHDRFCKMDNLRDRTRKNNPWIFAGTNYHFQDCYKRLDRQGGWLIWRVPAHTGSPKRIFDICSIEDRTEEGRRKIEAKLRRVEKEPPGTLNFPRMLDWRELYRTARAAGSHTYNCQILLNPLPEGEQRFDHEALDLCWIDEYAPPAEMWLYLRVDPALSPKKDSDETAIVVGGVRFDGQRQVIDGFMGREKQPTEIVKRTFTLARKWQERGYTVRDIGFEAVQFQEALAKTARMGIPERSPRYQGESVPMLTKPCAVRSIQRSRDTRKHERILEMDGPIIRGDLKFWRGCPIAAKLMGQFRNFPFDRDDGLDATHDLWVGTMTPPAAIDESPPILHPELMRLLRQGAFEREKPALVGTNSTVKLTAWG